MTQVFISYNPFTAESLIRINNEEISEMSRLASFREERLQMWVEKILPILVEECNDDQYEIIFHGNELDYGDLLDHIKEYRDIHKDVTINTKHDKAKDSNEKLKELTSLFEDMQNNCPFEDLKDGHIQENFYRALSSEFDVSVIATMSSGKSTLINAMLGKELMPAKNEACTATISRIKDIDDRKHFSAVCRNANYEVIEECKALDIEQMRIFNSNPEVSYIDIEGDIPFISSKSVNLVLVDTPGPNNSRNEEHRNHTYRIIKEKSKPMVLYVLNATQLETDDDDLLLRSVAEAMKVGGKQSKDRFIFAINKMDSFDPEKDDSIEDALCNVREYLSRHGISNPNIYLMSAEMAKVIRLKKNGYNLTRKQEATLNGYGLFLDFEKMHFSDYAPLSPKNKVKLNKMLEESRTHKDEHFETLIHSGIPAVELAINEYINKYAYTAKIKTAVDTFRKKVEDKKLHDILLQELAKDTKKREELNIQLKKVKKQLEDGKIASAFKDKIKNLDMKNDVDERVKEIRAKISKTLRQPTEKLDNKMSEVEVQKFILKLNRDVDSLQSDVKTDLEKLIDEIIGNNARRLIDEYEKHINSLMEDKSIVKDNYKTSKSFRFITGDLPGADELINRYKYSEDVVVGTRTEKNPERGGFFGFFKIWKPWNITVNVYEKREFVNVQTLYNEYVRPITGNFNENLDMAKTEALKEAEKFKSFFLNELDKLDAAIKKKISDLESLSESEKNLEKSIEENKNKRIWLEKFLKKLDSILEI